MRSSRFPSLSLFWHSVATCNVAQGIIVRRLRLSENEFLVKELNELFIHDADLWSSIPAIFLKDRTQVPLLKLAQASNNGAGAVSAQIAHDCARICRREHEQMKCLENNLFCNWVPSISAVHDTKVVELNVLVRTEMEAVSDRRTIRLLALPGQAR